MTRPRIPVDGKRADWPRKVAEIVGFAQKDLETLQAPAQVQYTPSPEPSNPTAGLTYFDSGSLKLRTYDGTVWNDHW